MFRSNSNFGGPRVGLAARGFTLIELIVTVAVAGILAAVAVPSFLDFIASSRASAEVRSLARFIASARSEAITRGTEVNVSRIGNSWSDGWRIWVDSNGNGSYNDGEALKQVVEIGSEASITVKKSGQAVSGFSFDNEGFLSESAVINFQYRSYPEKCSVDRDLTLNLSGQLTLSKRACS